MSKEDGGNAFPVGSYDHMTFEPQTVKEAKRILSGMSLRDYFAAKAMQGFNHNPRYDDWTHDAVAEIAYGQADAMLAAQSQS